MLCAIPFCRGISTAFADRRHPPHIYQYRVQHHFVIALAFYPALLIVSHKFGVHHQPFGLSDTLGGFIARLTLTLYALRWRVLFPLTSELAVKQVVNSSECVSPIPCINSSVIKLKYLTPLSKRFCCVSYRDFDI